MFWDPVQPLYWVVVSLSADLVMSWQPEVQPPVQHTVCEEPDPTHQNWLGVAAMLAGRR